MKKIFSIWSKKGTLPLKDNIEQPETSGNRQENRRAHSWFHHDGKYLGNIHIAAKLGYEAKVNELLLLKKNSRNARDKKKRTALHLACANGHRGVVTLLVERECDVNILDKQKQSALMTAVKNQHEECVAFLLEHGAHVYIRDILGNTALHHAVSGQSIAIAEKLLLYGANIEARNKKGFTPLLQAIKADNGQMVEFLITKGANVHAVDYINRTTLMLAVCLESTRISTLLLEQDVDIFAQDDANWFADFYASFNRCKNNLQLLQEYRGKIHRRRYLDLINLPLANEACTRSRDLKVHDKCSVVSPSMTGHQSSAMEFGQRTTIDKEKINIGGVLPVGSDVLHDPCESQLRENKGSKEEVDLDFTSQFYQEKLSGNENHHPHVNDSHEQEKFLLHQNHLLQNEISTLKLEIKTIKIRGQKKEKKYLEDIGILKEKNRELQKQIKINEETLAKIRFKYRRQLCDLSAENTALSTKLENEKENRESLKAEVESYHSRLATAIRHCEQSQTAEGDLELTFQKARDEWFHLQEKKNFDMSNLKESNEILRKQLSHAESKFRDLEMEFQCMRDALREKTLELERLQRILRLAQCQKMEIEHMYQKEQCKVEYYIRKQESFEERLSQLQRENMLLQQQLDDAHKEADEKGKLLKSFEDQFQESIKRLLAECGKQRLLWEGNEAPSNDCNKLKERLCQYENEKRESEESIQKKCFFNLLKENAKY